MDKCTREIRKEHWKNIINQCLQRPQGMTAKQWLAENGISEPTYYVWLKRLRQEAYGLATTNTAAAVSTEISEITFTEIPFKDEKVIRQQSPIQSGLQPAAVINTGNCSITVSHDISDRLLSLILKEVAHA